MTHRTDGRRGTGLLRTSVGRERYWTPTTIRTIAGRDQLGSHQQTGGLVRLALCGSWNAEEGAKVQET